MAKFQDKDLEASEVKYQANGESVAAFQVRPKERGRFPAIIVIHEWWGLNDHIRDVAMRFGREGYVALAPDLYGGKVTKDMDEASRLMSALKAEDALRTLNGAVDYLKRQEFVRADALGVVGFCMGGTFALLLPCHNSSIRAAAPFYGQVPDPPDPIARLAAPILYIYGDQDAWITMKDVERLREALKKYGKSGEIKIYPAPHAFFNDTRPDVYRPEAARDAWQQVTAFFARHLRAA